MIEVKELTKIYKSRKSGECVALDHISFTLPDKGFFFIIGKSGSGKTTLLSLLGGLDTITSGKIIENGQEVDAFNQKQQIYYRNSTIGFIFQDFHLLDDLTIYENIAFALDLQGEEDKDKVIKALKDTDLSEYEKRYPKELSGGQKQRVAIARALVKNPSIVLADEPTGNLDSKTTGQILDILKELAKEKLVIIVSHNLNDAYKYADEILELSDGKILNHLRRNKDFDSSLRIEDDTLIIPSNTTFTEENVKDVENKLNSSQVSKIRQDTNRFILCPEPENKNETSSIKIDKKHLKFKKTLLLSYKFSKGRWIFMALHALIFAILLTVLNLAQLIMNFNGGEVIASELQKHHLECNSFVKDTTDRYEDVDTFYLVDADPNDEEKFKNGGYEDNIYPLINYRFRIRDQGDEDAFTQKRATAIVNPFEHNMTLGHLITEESFLEKKYGPLSYVECVDEPKSYGIYITDFVADAMLINSTRFHNYKDLLGTDSKISTPNSSHNYGYVNGIINTNYKERYKDIIELLNNPNTSSEEINTLSTTDEFLAFYDEVSQYLFITYSFNPNFVDDFVESNIKTFASMGHGIFECNFGNQKFQFEKTGYFTRNGMKSTPILKDDEMLMNYEKYNAIFGTTYTLENYETDFVPIDIKYTNYALCDKNMTDVKYERTFHLKGLIKKNYCNYVVSDNVIKDLQKIEMYDYGYYFENNDMNMLMSIATKNNFIPNSSLAGSLTIMTQAVNIFSKFFNFIFFILCSAILFLMIQFGVKVVRDKIKEIGIIKALGGRNIDLMVIFGFQIAVMSLMMFSLYILSDFIFIDFANKILVKSLIDFTKGNYVIMNLSFLVVKWGYIFQNCGLGLIIVAISFLVPMLWLRRIKPANVIKVQE